MQLQVTLDISEPGISDTCVISGFSGCIIFGVATTAEFYLRFIFSSSEWLGALQLIRYLECYLYSHQLCRMTKHSGAHDAGSCGQKRGFIPPRDNLSSRTNHSPIGTGAAARTSISESAGIAACPDRRCLFPCCSGCGQVSETGLTTRMRPVIPGIPVRLGADCARLQSTPQRLAVQPVQRHALRKRVRFAHCNRSLSVLAVQLVTAPCSCVCACSLSEPQLWPPRPVSTVQPCCLKPF
jgi:hypothetical protein